MKDFLKESEFGRMVLSDRQMEKEGIGTDIDDFVKHIKIKITPNKINV